MSYKCHVIYQLPNTFGPLSCLLNAYIVSCIVASGSSRHVMLVTHHIPFQCPLNTLVTHICIVSTTTQFFLCSSVALTPTLTVAWWTDSSSLFYCFSQIALCGIWTLDCWQSLSDICFRKQYLEISSFCGMQHSLILTLVLVPRLSLAVYLWTPEIRIIFHWYNEPYSHIHSLPIFSRVAIVLQPMV